MAETISWVDPDGVETILTDQPNISILPGPEGRFMPPIDFVEDLVPGQPGAVLRTVRVGVREIAIPLVVMGDAPSEVRATIRDLLGAFNPRRGNGTLKVVAPDGSEREIVARYAQGLEGSEGRSESGHHFQKFLPVFRAVDPFFQDTEDTEGSWDQLAVSTFFDGSFFPLDLSADGILSDFSVDNDGDVESWPVWVITGPGEDPTLENTTTGKSLTLDHTLAGPVITPGEETWESDAVFTRATTALDPETLASVASGVVRYVTGKYGEAIFLEEATTNLVQRSQELENAYWTHGSLGTRTADATTAPDGTTTADRHAEAAATSAHHLYRGGLTIRTFSIYAKVWQGRDWIWMAVGAAGAAEQCWFNISTGAIGTKGANVTAEIVSVGNGWYRCSVSVAASGAWAQVGPASADGVNSYAGDTAKGIYLWGAQATALTYPTTYVPTTTASATRNAETLTIPGSTLSASAGTIEGWFRYNRTPGGTNQSYFDLRGAPSGTNTGIYLYTIDGQLALLYGTGAGNNTVYSGAVGDTVKDTWYHLAVTWAAGTIKLYINGVLKATGASLSLTAPTDIYFGANVAAGAQLDGYIDDLRISSVARSALEIAATAASLTPLEWDEDTTSLMPFDGDIDRLTLVTEETIDTPAETVTIDTRPGIKTIVDQDGNNLYGSLAPGSSLWPLEPGENEITLDMTATGDGSEIALSYRRRYLGA